MIDEPVQRKQCVTPLASGSALAHSHMHVLLVSLLPVSSSEQTFSPALVTSRRLQSLRPCSESSKVVSLQFEAQDHASQRKASKNANLRTMTSGFAGSTLHGDGAKPTVYLEFLLVTKPHKRSCLFAFQPRKV